MTFFDTADSDNGGESEKLTGRLVPTLFAGREQYVLATKVFTPTMPGENGGGRRDRDRFVSMQNQHNLVYREEEREMIPPCLDQGVGVIPWSPLARGVLVGNLSRSGERRTV